MHWSTKTGVEFLSFLLRACCRCLLRTPGLVCICSVRVSVNTTSRILWLPLQGPGQRLDRAAWIASSKPAWGLLLEEWELVRDCENKTVSTTSLSDKCTVNFGNSKGLLDLFILGLFMVFTLILISKFVRFYFFLKQWTDIRVLILSASFHLPSFLLCRSPH